MKKFNYENKIYLKKLNELKLSYYSKYIRYIEKYLPQKSSKFLDVGCGNGTVLKQLRDKGYGNGYGAEISELFIKSSKKKGIEKVYHYDGTKLPFKNNYFDLIGSFNVLEHTQNPEQFLKEEIGKLKNKGIIIVACPNFLSVLFPSNNRRLKGLKNKLRNLLLIISKLLVKEESFERMPPVIAKKFEYDDDAIVVTNMINLKYILRKNNCTIIYESGFINYDSILFRAINMFPLIRYLLPSCFVVAQK